MHTVLQIQFDSEINTLRVLKSVIATLYMQLKKGRKNMKTYQILSFVHQGQFNCEFSITGILKSMVATLYRGVVTFRKL